MTINLATIDFSGVSSGPSAKLQEKDVTILLSEYVTEVTPDSGYDGMSKVSVFHSPVQETKTATILLTDTTTEILPDEGYDGMLKVSVSHGPVQEQVEQTITENGRHKIIPETGYDAMIRCVVDVDVSNKPIPAQWDGTPDTELVSSLGWSQSSYDNYPVTWMKYDNDKHKVSEYDKTYEATGTHQKDTQMTYAKMQTLNGDCSNYFSGCTNLKAIPDFDFTNVTNLNSMFYKDSSLEFLPALDLKNITSASNMFAGCSSLTILPKLNLSGVQNMKGMFQLCSNLKYVPDFDFSSATTLTSFYSNTAIEEIGNIIAPNCTYADSIFFNCHYLKKIGRLYFADSVNNNKIFAKCTALTSVAGFSYRGEYNNRILTTVELPNLTHFIFEDYINCTWDTGFFNLLPNLDYESIKSILVACSKTTLPGTPKSITFANITMQDQNGELQNLINTCVNEKGWVINNLTITE